MSGSSERVRQLKESISRQAAQPEKVSEEVLSVLVFSLAQQRYAFPLQAVCEVHRTVEITPIPGLPTTVLGAVGLRGQVFPVLDLHQMLKLPEFVSSSESRIVIIQHQEKAAVLADKVEDITDLPSHALQPPPPDAQGETSDLVQAIVRQARQTIHILDPARLLEAVRHGK